MGSCLQRRLGGMKKDVTICIGTVGYPTFDKCYKICNNIYKSDDRVKDLVVIKNHYPTSAWLNKMRESCKTTWCLQVDEDMYISKNAIDELLDLARKTEGSGKSVLNASGLLFDIFLETNIGSLKLWNTKVFGLAEFKDVQGSDRRFARDATKLGFSNVEIKSVLGRHDSAPSPDIAYFKYREYVAKIKHFQSAEAARKFVSMFKKRHRKKGIIGIFAYEGAVSGLSRPCNNKTKNYFLNKNSEDLRKIRKKYGMA